MAANTSASNGLPRMPTLESGNRNRPRVISWMDRFRSDEGSQSPDDEIEKQLKDQISQHQDLRKHQDWKVRSEYRERREHLNYLWAKYGRLKKRPVKNSASTDSNSLSSYHRLFCHWTFEQRIENPGGINLARQKQIEIHEGDIFSDWACRIALAIQAQKFDGLQLVYVTQIPFISIYPNIPNFGVF